MHVRVKEMAFLSMLAAVSMILMLLGNIIESNTLFLYAGAACLTGVAIRRYSVYSASLMASVCLVLSLLLLPNKLYAGTYFAFVLYIIVWEICDRKRCSLLVSYMVKYMLFNLFYLPVLCFFPSLIIGKTMGIGLFIVCIIAGQVILFIFDIAYKKIMPVIMSWVRRLGDTQ